MSYRKIKKEYLRRFGCTTFIKFLDGDEKILRKASKRASARYMQRAIYINSFFWL